MNVPTEKKEGISLKKQLVKAGYTFTHVGNESGTAFSADVQRFMTQKRMQGVSRGFPDYVVVCKNRKGLVFVELKRQRKLLKSGKLGASPSKLSPEQITWLEILTSCGDNILAEVAYGADHAMELITSFDV